MKAHLQVHKLSHFTTIYVYTTMVIGLIFFNGIPFYINISSGAFYNYYKTGNATFQHSIYYQLPFDYKHNIYGYVVILVFNWYKSFICCYAFCSYDLLMYLMVFHVWGHLQILIKSMENFRRPIDNIKSNETTERFSADTMKEVTLDLKEFVEHHNLIKEFTTTMTKIFGPTLILYYLFHLVTGCILLLECSQMDPEGFIRYGPLTFLSFQQLIQISFVFEIMAAKSDKLINAVYDVPWECMNTSNRKTVYIILIQSQKVITVNALNMVNVGVQTMTSVLKSCVSYFIMLRTISDVK